LSGFIACLSIPWKCLNFEKKLKTLESAWKQIRCLKVLEKSLNLNLQYVEILHLITVLEQTLVCISPVLGFSLLAYLTDSHWNLSPDFIITILASPVQYTSGSHVSLNFEAPYLGYDFLSTILVLENCKFNHCNLFLLTNKLTKSSAGNSLASVFEKCLNFVLWKCYEPWIVRDINSYVCLYSALSLHVALSLIKSHNSIRVILPVIKVAQQRSRVSPTVRGIVDVCS